MYIIADSGSTKTDWCVVNSNGERKHYHTSGINAVMMSKEQVTQLLSEEYIGERDEIERVYFYGAGCGEAFPTATEMIQHILTTFFNTPHIEATSDLMAVARGLCKNQEGIACILGTGSNSCYYNGVHIVKNIRPLGFILGDEGSGASMGKKMLANVLKEILPYDLRSQFLEKYPFDYAEFVNKVYRQPLPQPSRFLASMTHFIAQHINRSEISTIVESSFSEFIERNVLQYAEAKEIPVSFTGSIAYHFRPQLEKVLSHYNLTLGIIEQSPMQGLIELHR